VGSRVVHPKWTAGRIETFADAGELLAIFEREASGRGLG